jgi:hypothetical protein
LPEPDRKVKYVHLLLVLLALSGCQTDSMGRRETVWEALKRWDQSLTDTENRLQGKTYND